MKRAEAALTGLGLFSSVLAIGIFNKPGAKGPASKVGAGNSVEWWEGRGGPNESTTPHWVDPRWDDEAPDTDALGEQIKKGNSIGTEFSPIENPELWPAYITGALIIIGGFFVLTKRSQTA